MKNRVVGNIDQVRALVRQNIRLAKLSKSGHLGAASICRLRHLTTEFGLSFALGDFQYLDNGWYITHAGLLRLAARRRCIGIAVQEVGYLCDPLSGRWVFKATVCKSRGARFSGYGDADPSNVSPVVHGAEMRVAETRAVNRALRKAYGIGLCSVEELGWTPKVSPTQSNRNGSSPAEVNGNGHSASPRLRDRLCLLIREHQLDPTLVKAYAADYCGTPALHNATREQVEVFISHLTERATKDRAALLCHLNSFARPPEATS